MSSMIKQCTPITYFEQWLPIILELDKGFFTRDRPDITAFDKILDDGRKNDFDILTKKYGNKANFIEKFARLVVGLTARVQTKLENRVDLKRLQDTKDIEYANEMVDYFYTVRANATIDNGMLNVHNIEDKEESLTKMLMERIMWSFHKFNKYGRKQFKVDEQLTSELLLTGVQGVDASFLKLPYSSFCINIPYNRLLTIRGELIQSIYVSEVLSLIGQEVKRKIELCFFTGDRAADAIHFYIENGQDLLPQIEEQITKKYSSKLAKRETTEIMSFILATILYINSKDAIKQEVFATVLNKNQHSKFPSCVLGYGIPINKSIHITRENYESNHTINVLKYTVRGHFRTYVKGEHWKIDQVLWIKPFLKGSEKDNSSIPIKPSNYNIKKQSNDKSNNG